MTDLHPPLPADLVDELLSAELDGELDGAADDLGVAIEVLRAALAATPGVDARRAELTRAQQVSVAHHLELGDLERERLVRAGRAGAGTAPRRARLGFVLGAVASAAAIAIVVALVGRGSSSRNDSKSASAPTYAASRPDGSAQSRAGSLYDFGAIASDTELRAAVERATATARSAAPVDQTTTTSKAEVATNGPGTAASSAPSTTTDRASLAARCIAGLPSPPGTRDVELLGFGTYQGRPVAVARGVAADQLVIWAYTIDGCRVVVTAFASAP